jgi:hypothetical protein
LGGSGIDAENFTAAGSINFVAFVDKRAGFFDSLEIACDCGFYTLKIAG